MASSPTRHVVGIGASAGGLEALEKLFASMPLDTGMSFVVVQHLSPDFESHMAELLGRVTDLPVCAVTDGAEVEPNSVYLIPPKMEMVISNGRLLLTERSKDQALAHPIDQFLRALAQDNGRYSVGIILSGTGSDGSRGIGDIDEAGGLVIAQDPSTCKFDSMPLNAQQTGHVHVSMPPESIGPALAKYVADGTSPSQLQQRERDLLEETGVRRVFQLLQSTHRIDFSNYKATTVERRIQRRMDLARLPNLQEYIDWISSDPHELNELYRDLLIGVTEFFRDPEAFEKLEREIIPMLLRRHAGGELRVWVCGCATGEEAYSIAMLFDEAIARSDKQFDMKMFATDAHKESLHKATVGLYEESKLDRVSEQRKQRYFIRRRDGYLVNADLRRRIVFAPHNALSDPPFTQIDLVACRNMLIYLQPHAQKKTLSLFHFALRSSGVLFLGPSETPGDLNHEFTTLDSHWKIFEKRRDVRLPIELRMPLSQTNVDRPLSQSVAQPRPPRSLEPLPAVFEVLLGDMMPPSVLVDESYEILHTFGGAESYLRFPAGRPSAKLLEVVDPSVKTSLSGALQHASRDHTAVRYSGLPAPGDGTTQLQLVVEPKYIPANQSKVFLVKFEQAGQAGLADRNAAVPDAEPMAEMGLDEAKESRIESLEHELNQSRQNLQATIEELQTSNEQLQATNEEMIASNEELQSTNQELHSVNEELYSVNAEHQRRLNELKQANDDMNNLLASTRVGVIFLDRELYIRRFTPEIGRVFHLVSQDLGRSVEMILPSLDHDNFMQDVRAVLENHQEQESEVRDRQGNSYLVRMQPYRTDEDVVGVVLAFIDIQRLTEAQEDVARFKFMCDSAADAQTLIDSDGRFAYCNEMMRQRLGYSEEELSHMTLMQIDTSLSRADFVLLFEQAVAEQVEPFESEHRRKDGSTYPTETSVTSVAMNGQTYLFATVRDITRRKAATRELRLLENAVSSVASGIVITDPHRPDHPITFANDGFLQMTGYDADEVIGHNCRFLQCEETDPAAVDKIRTAVRRGESCNVLIRNRRKDGSRFWNDLQITPVTDESGKIINFVGVLNDVTDRETATRQARQNEDRIRWIMDSTAEGIYGVNSTGHCTFCNESAAQMLGYDSSSELVGKSLHELIHHTKADGEPYPPQECPIRATAVNGKKINRDDEVFWRKNGSSFPVEYWSYPKQREGGFAGAVITFVDITQRKRDEEKLREAQEQADAANEAKSEFLANMSHELRTPMAAVLGFAEILQHECAEEQILEKISAIQRNGDYLLQLLDDVLDLSKIEAGAVKLNQSTCDVDEVLRDLYDLMHIRAEELERGLAFHCPEPLPETITTDPARLRQVLVNLIGNGLKFSPGGRVDVTTTMAADSDQPMIQFEVADTGIGMSRSQLKRLFKPFTQADAKIAKQFGGTGLGLSISKRLVESLGGNLSVDSQVGLGSTFTITLPAAPVGPMKPIAPPPHDEPDDADDPSQNGQGLSRLSPEELGPLDARVLIADDMRDIRYIGRHFLRKAGCRVSVVENGQQAVEAIQQAIASDHPFDIAVLDMQMPVMDGIEATRHLRQHGVQIPVLALTADAMKGTRDRVIAAGFTEYLTKPIDSQVLLATVKRLLNGQARR